MRHAVYAACGMRHVATCRKKILATHNMRNIQLRLTPQALVAGCNQQQQQQQEI